VAVTRQRQEMGRSKAKAAQATVSKAKAREVTVREARGDGGPTFSKRQMNNEIKGALNGVKVVKSGNAAGGETVVKRKLYRPGAKLIMEIKKMQRCTKPMLRFAPLTRLVRERGKLIVEKRIGGVMEFKGVKYKRAAMEMLREMVEIMMVRIMEDALLCCLHRKVKGVQVKDMRLAERIRMKSKPVDWKLYHLTAEREPGARFEL
jgi:histone H3/H4